MAPHSGHEDSIPLSSEELACARGKSSEDAAYSENKTNSKLLTSNAVSVRGGITLSQDRKPFASDVTWGPDC